MVVSHDCEIDKSKDTILLAPVVPLSALDALQQARVQEMRVWSQAPLPHVPGLGDCMVDFRSIGAVPAEAVRLATRIASMTAEARRLLAARLIGFFTRLEPPGGGNPEGAG